MPYIFVLLTTLVVFAGAALQPFAPFEQLLVDSMTAAAAVVTEQCCSPLLGAVSNLGILAWTASASICLFAALLLVLEARRNAAAFALAGGLLTGLLALDDLFMLHEAVLPPRGIPQPVVLGIYLALAAAYGFVFRRHLLAARWPVLALAALAFGVSLAIDQFHPLPRRFHTFAEELAKFVGILAWLAFHVEAMVDLLMRARSEVAPAGGP
jgi:hypothetical protein